MDYEKEALSQFNDTKYYETIHGAGDTVITTQTSTITKYLN